MTPHTSKAALLIAALAFVLPACCSPGPMSELPVTFHPQETERWCWAASGEMVMEYLGKSVPQCTQANDQFGLANCPCNECGPNPVADPSCVKGGWPEFSKYGFSSRRTNGTALSLRQLKEELSRAEGCGRRPVAFTWRWIGEGAHMMVAYGYESIGDSVFIYAYDPWQPCEGDKKLISYDEYVEGPDHTHWDDFYGIKKL